MNKPKLLFVYEHPKPEWWLDGLYAALNVLEEDFEITRLNLNEDKKYQGNYDFILGWGGFKSNVDKWMNGMMSVKKGLCIAGNAFPPESASNYDVLFHETKWYRPQINFHPNIVHAFGINTDIYNKPEIPVPVIWDYIGVGSLASWKRWEKMVDKKGIRLVIGEYQEGNQLESLNIASQILRGGVMVSPMVSPYDLANFYAWSHKAYIPANVYGGGERAVLEARSCGLEVEIEEDNPKLKELLELEPIPDHNWYAKRLKEGIMSCI